MQVASELKKINVDLDYNNDRELLKKFILFYSENDEYKYLSQLKDIGERIEVELEDLAKFDESLYARFTSNCFSYTQMLHSCINDIVYNEDVVDPTGDAFFVQRVSRFKEKFPDKQITDVFPSFLLKNYAVLLKPCFKDNFAVRGLKSENIGQYVSVRGVVTRVAQTKPAVRVATYICDSCGSETYQQVAGNAFDMLEECKSERCIARRIKGTLVLATGGSKFMRFVSVQVQELSGDVPFGCVPRMLAVECYALGDDLRPGDSVILSGIFLPKPYTGLKKLRAGLLNDTYLLCMHIDKELPVLSQIKAEFDVENVVESFAPEIHGMTDVKKILLLAAVGSPGVTKADGMRIRGDINVLLLGDPGIAKSQLLRGLKRVTERCIITTGRGASGAGLTAAVLKDGNDVVLEGGALVLADKGICCIDELDKMSEHDRTAIHEVMEQQSVSVAKAGINATLNARCSVIGAANPIRGRFSSKLSVQANTGLPTSLLSRFDVVCVLKDECNEDYDLAMAHHISSLHFGDAEPTGDYEALRTHIAEARLINPVITDEHRSVIVDSYVKARKEVVTPRHLLALLRLCLAHARLRHSKVVETCDVTEAIRLLETMKVPTAPKKRFIGARHEIYNYILSMAQDMGDRRVVSLYDISTIPFPKEQVDSVVKDFAESGIWVTTETEIVIFN